MEVSTMEIPIYLGYLEIVISDNLSKAAKKYKITKDVGCYGAFCHRIKGDRGSEKYIIFVQPDVSTGLLIHELIHIKNYVFKDCGVKVKGNDEHEAYFVMFLFEEIEK